VISYDTFKVLRQYWADIGSPCAIRLSKALQNGEQDVVIKILSSLNQQRWMDPYRHRRARLAIDIIKKADYLPIDIDQSKACLTAFCLAEKQCRDTNHRFQLVGLNHPTIPLDKMRLVKRVKREMRRLLGPIPDMFYHEGGFGPGSTLSNPRSRSSIYEKLDIKNPTITRDCAWFYPALPSRLRSVWGCDDNFHFVKANRFMMVPKNYKTFRGICVEPLINAYVQRGFGLHMKKRLRRFGIDIDTAESVHKELAKAGSLGAGYSTIDMSMASDTIAYEVIKAVLPRNWFTLLDRCRSKATDISKYFIDNQDLFEEYGIIPTGHSSDGEADLYRLEKFSSMGNGFTFELETMLFTAIARACGDKTARSFGDDLIIRSSYNEPVLDALKFFGFTINIDKSFTSGSFRESCGGDYRLGISIEGETLKTEPKCIDDWYNLHNRLYVMSKKYNLDIKRTLHVIRAQVPKNRRYLIPEYLGTGGFFSDKPRGETVYGITHYRTYRRVRYQPNKDWSEKYTDEVLLASILLGGAANGPDSGQKTAWRVEWDPVIVDDGNGLAARMRRILPLY
jgi:hypothetical protein